MQKIKKFVIHNSLFLVVFMLLVMPIISFADFQGPCPPGTHSDGSACVPNPSGLVPCDNSADYPCDFNALMTLVEKVFDFIFQFMVIPIAAIMMAYAGFELVISGGSTEKRGIAKKVFWNAVIGLAIATVAWLIVKLILTTLGFTSPGLLNG